MDRLKRFSKLLHYSGAGLLALILFIGSATAETVYRVGIVPQYDARTTHNIWRPVLDALENRTGLRFSLLGAPTIPTFEQEFASGSYDFAYMNPYHLLVANRLQGYVPLVHDTGRFLHGVLVVRKDNAIRDIKQLQGQIVAFPAPNALGASLLMRAELVRQHRIRVVPHYVKTHDSVYLNVILGETGAGGGVQKTLQKQSASIRNALRILYKTQATASHPFTAHPRVPAAIRLQVQKALIDLGQSEQGRKLLARVPIKVIGATSLADYESLKQLGLDEFYVQGL